MVKVVFIDMDGTLFNDECEVPRDNIDAVINAQKAGVKIVISTGRSMREADFAFKDFTPDYFIGINGGVIWDYTTNNLLRKLSMRKDNAASVKTLLDKTGVFYKIYTHDEGYCTKHCFDNIHKSGMPDVYIREIGKEIKILTDIHEIESVKFMIPHLANSGYFEQQLENINGVYQVSPHIDNYEVLPIEISKGKALQYLCDYMGIPREYSMAIGDSGNDYDMLQVAGYSVAMGNGFEEIKEIADMVAPDNNNCGVAHAINKIILKK